MQDICSRSDELPSSYRLKDVKVHWRECIARGGEAFLYRGTLGNRQVVVREVQPLEDNSWTSDVGKRDTKVNPCHCDTAHQNC